MPSDDIRLLTADVPGLLDRLRMCREHGFPVSYADLGFAIGEIVRLRGIVEKLPKTADGVPVVPGMVYWFEYTNAPGEFSNDFASDIYNAAGETEFDKDCYSTREAAEAARKAGGSWPKGTQ